MSAFNAIVSSIASLFTSSADTNNSPSGANAVRTAVSELESIVDKTFEADLGEPTIVQDEDVEYFNDPKVVVPIHDAPFKGANRLVFDLPEGRDDKFSTFMSLLKLFDLDFDSMEQLAGKTVPMTFIGGNASVLWDEVTDEPPKGTKANSYTKEDVEKMLEGSESTTSSGDSTADDSDKAAEDTESKSSEDEESSSTDTESAKEQDSTDDSESGDTESSDSTGVNVEEKTVSTDGEGNDA